MSASGNHDRSNPAVGGGSFNKAAANMSRTGESLRERVNRYDLINRARKAPVEGYGYDQHLRPATYDILLKQKEAKKGDITNDYYMSICTKNFGGLLGKVFPSMKETDPLSILSMADIIHEAYAQHDLKSARLLNQVRVEMAQKILEDTVNFLHPDDRPLFLEVCVRAALTKSPTGNEINVFFRNIVREISTRNLLDKNQKPVNALAGVLIGLVDAAPDDGPGGRELKENLKESLKNFTRRFGAPHPAAPSND